MGKEFGEIVVKHDAIIHNGSHDVVILTPAMRKNAVNIAEVAGKLAGFRYDPSDKTLEYLGEKKIKILVDSIEKSYDEVKQLDHRRFSKMDVIYNPAGRYQDFDVVLNLHTKTNYVGYDLQADDQVQLMPGGRNGKGNDFSYSDGSMTFNYVRNKLTFGVYGQYIWQRNGTSQYHARHYPFNDLCETDIEQPRDKPTDFNKIFSAYGKAFVDYKISSNHTISLNGYYQHTKVNKRAYQDMSVVSPAAQDSYRETSLATSTTDPVFDFGGTIYYVGHNKRWDFSATAEIYNVKNDEYANVERSSGFSLPDNRIARAVTALADADITFTPSNEKWQFNFNYRWFNYDYRYRRMETDKTLSHTNQKLNRGMFTASWVPLEKLTIRLSGGVQATSVNSGDGVEMHATPRADLYMSYKFTEKNWMRIYYTTSVSQPFLGQVTDYGQFTDSLMYNQGNPYLRDAPFHNLNVVFGLWNHITLRPKCGISPRSISTIYEAGYGLRPDGEEGYYVVQTPYNTSQKYWGFRIDWNAPIKDVWFLSGAFDLTQTYARFEELHRKGLAFNVYLSGQYYMSRIGMMCYATYTMDLRDIPTPQANSSMHTDRLYLMIRKSFLKNRLSVSLTYHTPLHLTSGKSRERLHSPALDMLTWSNNQFRMDNRLSLRIAYSLHHGKKVNPIDVKQLLPE
ncbi:MAG: outer membrane beta-barrel protein [Bacteroidales bacterium]|nr:outer membrane beta-barrel protein [Bacteroidales bacterium]